MVSFGVPIGLIEDSITYPETGGQDVFLEVSSAPSSQQTRGGEQNPVLCEQCCELCVRSYVCSVVLVVV